VRLSYLVILEHSKDATYYSGLVGLWSFPEIAFGFLVACLPVIRGFLNIVRNSWAVSCIRTLRKRVSSLFKRPRPSSQPTFAHAAAKERASPITNPAQLRYEGVRPQISDVEYHELVLKSGNSWVTEEERQQLKRPGLVAKTPRTVVRSQKQYPRGIPQLVQVEESNSEGKVQEEDIPILSRTPTQETRLLDRSI
jgi:hypothetical protein